MGGLRVLQYASGGGRGARLFVASCRPQSNPLTQVSQPGANMMAVRHFTHGSSSSHATATPAVASDAFPVLLLAGVGILATAILSKFSKPNPIPEIVYTPVWGRAEPVRLALAAAGLEWKEVHFGTMDAMKAKAGSADFPFGQVPIFIDGSLRVAQMDSFMRHIGRKHGMYGRGLKEAAEIDMVMLGVEDLRKQYLKVIYEGVDAAAYVANHINPLSTKGRNGGAHFSFLSGILTRNGGGHGYMVGSKLSIADIQVYNMCKLVLRENFGHEENFKRLQPLLAAFVERIEAEPRIAEYVATKQCSKVNGNEKG